MKITAMLRFVLVAIAAVMVLALVACGTTEANGEETTAKVENTTVADNNDATEGEVLIDGKTKYIIDYLGGDTLHLSFTQYTTNLNSSYDAEHIKEIKDTFVGDNEAIFISFTDDTTVYLSWSDGEYVYELSDYDGIYSEELLIAMAESVK